MRLSQKGMVIKMKAMLIKDGGRLEWSDVAPPVIKPDEVLVKVKFAAVNRADLMQREGLYPSPQGCPDWCGLEISGEIAETGALVSEKSIWKKGDKVCALLGGGGYAEYVAVRYDMLMPIPANCTMIEAAAMPEAFATAYLNLFYEGGLKEGDVLLMNAGASGLASVVIPMAKAFGAYVITTIIDESKRETVAKTGADLIVNTKSENIVEVLKRFESEGRPIALAIDCLGGEIVADCLPHLRYMGKWIMIATLAGDIAPVDMRKLYVKNVRLVGSTLRSKPQEVKAEILKRLVEKVWDKVSDGEIRPAIFAVMPITEAEKAHDLLYSGKSAGKVVLKVCNEAIE